MRRLSIEKVVVVGGGYVGLPLAVRAAEVGFEVCILDRDLEKVRAICRGESYIGDVPGEAVRRVCEQGKLTATDAPEEAYADVDAVLICVPTPLQITHDPDLSYVNAAVDALIPHLHAGLLIALESTVYPGYTREVLCECVRGAGFSVGEDIFVSFSPERVDPANACYRVTNTPKVVGGRTKECAEVAASFYRRLVPAGVVVVGSTDTAEMVKILENTFRAVNIALANEIAVQCDILGIDVWEVIDAAKTKPFGFMPFYPGPGVGGHCLIGGETVCVRDAAGARIMRLDALYAEVTQATPEPLDVLSLDTQTGHARFSPILAMSRNPSPDRVLELQLETGRRLRVTDKHPMLLRGPDGIELREAQACLPGDRVVLLGDWPVTPGWSGRLDLLDLIGEAAGPLHIVPKDGDWQDHDGVVRPACRACGASAKDVYRTNSLPLRVYRRLEADGTLPFGREDILLATGRGNAWVRVPCVLEMDEDFARLVGYYLSEGCLAKGPRLRPCFAFGRHEPELVEDCCAILLKFGFTPRVHELSNCETTHVKVSSRLLGILLRDVLHCGVRSEDVRVPDILMTGPGNIRWNVLVGFLRGDGRVPPDGNTVEGFTSSPVLLQQLVLLLHGAGLVPHLSQDRPLFSLYGEQALMLSELFTGEKHRRMADYSAKRKHRVRLKYCQFHEGYSSVALRAVHDVAVEPVYSLEVEGTHTFITSHGIAVHNCIGPDPYYLAWRMRSFKYESQLVAVAGRINASMPGFVVMRLEEELREQGKPLLAARVLLVGVAYKPDVVDTRESPALDILALLREKGAIVDYVDPFVPELHDAEGRLVACGLDPESPYTAHDAAVIVTHHTAFDYPRLIAECPLVLDTRGVTRGYAGTERVRDLCDHYKGGNA